MGKWTFAAVLCALAVVACGSSEDGGELGDADAGDVAAEASTDAPRDTNADTRRPDAADTGSDARDSAAPPDTRLEDAPRDTGPDTTSPADTASPPDTWTPPADTAVVDTAPPVDAALEAERARCLSGAPRLEWRPATGCHDTVGVEVVPGATKRPFDCTFRVGDGLGRMFCFPTLAGRVQGSVGSGTDDVSVCSRNHLLDATDWSSTTFVELATQLRDDGGIAAAFSAGRLNWSFGAKWSRYEGPSYPCQVQGTPYPYRNAEGLSIVIHDKLLPSLFVRAP